MFFRYLAFPAVMLGVGIAMSASAAAAQTPADEVMELSAAELFAFADAARDAGNFDSAERAYRALAQDPDVELRTEARFRLALMLADRMERPRDAAVLLRQILDEKPDAARVRVELARIQVKLGNYGEAERELRAAQAAGLPAEVERLVRFYAQALSARKPLGGSIQVAFAPDSNVNRATASDTLETIIGDFDLSDDARASSGIGLSVRAQGYYREGVGADTDILFRASGSGRLYTRDRFNDYILSLQVGPQLKSGVDEVTLSGVVSHRWFGNEPYTLGYGVSANYRHPLDRRTRLTVDATAIRTDDRINALRDANGFSLAAGLDHAFTASFGGGVRLSGYRAVARDPGYSQASGGLDAYLFREFGKTTLVVDMGYSRLEADQRLFLYPERRIDDRFEIGLAGTFRSLRVGRFAPLASIKFENNDSTVGIYDYRRLSAEFGVTAAF
jgi:hypothetical protein